MRIVVHLCPRPCVRMNSNSVEVCISRAHAKHAYVKENPKTQHGTGKTKKKTKTKKIEHVSEFGAKFETQQRAPPSL